ncbi:MAG: TetR/AcrR family transcriptional regulator, partial [Gemmatimonadota bacterium]|nr:TetR/AcrR family transcriptional regulator [Gemmatimonadota bacterium]
MIRKPVRRVTPKTATRTGARKSARRVPGPRPDGETQQRILEAARTVFVRRGTQGARMQEIAREAGVNQALLHYYF